MTTAYAYLGTVDDKVAALIPALVQAYEAGLGYSDDDQVARMIGKLALLYPNVKLTDAEAEARLELYIDLLRDIPFDCLSAGFREIAKECRFFPTVAEIRAKAEPKMLDRRSRMYALRTILMKHRADWQPPFDESDRCSPEEAAAILAKFKIGANAG